MTTEYYKEAAAPRDREAGTSPARGQFRKGDRDREQHQPLRETVAGIDQAILKLLLKRYNCMRRMCGRHAHLQPREERFLRENWENAAGKISRDTRLIRQMFTLIQEADFLPRPEPGDEVRQGFNLAPTPKPVSVSMPAPVSCRKSRIWTALAAMSDTPVTISSTLLNENVTACCKMFNQLGANIGTQDNGTVTVRSDGAFAPDDKVIFVGDDILNFALVLGRYIGCHSRAKFTGEDRLKTANLASLRRWLPQLGARLINTVPQSDGFPVRVECSGIVPSEITVPADIPHEIVAGMVLGALFWEKTVVFDTSAYPEKDDVRHLLGSVVKAAKAGISFEENAITVTPGTLQLPDAPALPANLSIAGALLALPAAAGGEVRLSGFFPKCPASRSLVEILAWGGASVSENGSEIISAAAPATDTVMPEIDNIPDTMQPLAYALAAYRTLKGEKNITMPVSLRANEDAEIFLRHIGIEMDENGIMHCVTDAEDRPIAWTAPSPQWATAAAIVSFARAGLKLSNAGIMTALYPAFWPLFNSLPDPQRKRMQEKTDEQPVVRRRIITSQPANIRPRDNDD